MIKKWLFISLLSFAPLLAEEISFPLDDSRSICISIPKDYKKMVDEELHIAYASSKKPSNVISIVILPQAEPKYYVEGLLHKIAQITALWDVQNGSLEDVEQFSLQYQVSGQELSLMKGLKGENEVLYVIRAFTKNEKYLPTMQQFINGVTMTKGEKA